jgi:RND family efflux transporter MFP subunit
MNAKENVNFSEKFLRRIYITLFILLIIAIVGIGMRIIEYVRLRNATEKQAVLTVAVIKATHDSASEEIVLPGNVLAWHSATIFARTNGYLIKWMVDIGTHVKAGELLAEISTPEVDAALRQTEADLKTAIALNELAQTTAIRWKKLLKTDSVSKQETDVTISNANAKAAVVVSTRANRDRLRDLVSYQRIYAPFDGVIASRTTDIGRLINAGSSGNVPLFRLVQSNRLRIYVRVPQYFSARIKPGLTAQLYFAEHPGKSYTAKLLDTAKAIDAMTRSLLLQLEFDNSKNELLPGSYTQVHFKLPPSATSVRLPVNTLIFRDQGLQVATIDGDSKALLKSITIGRDFGDIVEIVAGLQPGELVILNPPDSLFSGQKVHIFSEQAAEKGLKES